MLDIYLGEFPVDFIQLGNLYGLDEQIFPAEDVHSEELHSGPLPYTSEGERHLVQQSIVISSIPHLLIRHFSEFYFYTYAFIL